MNKNFPEKKIKLVTDSDTAFRYINFKNLGKEPYRSIADEIIDMHLIKHIECIKSHTHIKRLNYLTWINLQDKQERISISQMFLFRILRTSDYINGVNWMMIPTC